MTDNDSDIQTLLSHWAEAEAKGDRAALASLLTDDFLGIGPMGFILPKQAWVDRHAPDGLKYDSFDLDEVQVRQYGNTATVTARLDHPGSYQGNPVPAATRATVLVVDQPQGKRLAGITLTFMAGTPGAPAFGPPR